MTYSLRSKSMTSLPPPRPTPLILPRPTKTTTAKRSTTLRQVSSSRLPHPLHFPLPPPSLSSAVVVAGNSRSACCSLRSCSHLTGAVHQLITHHSVRLFSLCSLLPSHPPPCRCSGFGCPSRPRSSLRSRRRRPLHLRLRDAEKLASAQRRQLQREGRTQPPLHTQRSQQPQRPALARRTLSCSAQS